MGAKKASMKKVGFLNTSSARELADPIAAFHRGLGEVGYVDQKNVDVITQFAKNDLAALPKLADKLMRDAVEVLVATGGLAAAQAAVDAVKQSGASTFIAYIAGLEPKNIQSLPHKPVGVHTSTTDSLPERRDIAAKLLGNTQIGLIIRPNTAVGNSEKALFGPSGVVLEASSLEEVDARFAEAKRKGLALLVSADSFFTSNRKKIAASAKQQGVPTVYAFREIVEAGGLMSFGPNLANAYRQAGVLAGQMLSGGEPPAWDLKTGALEISINVKTAKALGVDPAKLLAHADHVIS